MTERLMRSSQNKIIGGVCGGLGDYFDIDPVFVRIIAVVLAFANGIGFLAYIIAWIIMPKREFIHPAANTSETSEEPKLSPRSSWSKYIPGIILIIIGTFLLARQYGFGFDWGEFWAVAFICAGLYFILRWKRKSNDNTSNNHTNSENGGQL